MKKTVSLDHAMLHATHHQKEFADGRSLRDSKFAKFMQDGNMITGKMACQWHTGDGKKYGWKSDASMLGDAKHYGVKMIHVAD